MTTSGTLVVVAVVMEVVVSGPPLVVKGVLSGPLVKVGAGAGGRW